MKNKCSVLFQDGYCSFCDSVCCVFPYILAVRLLLQEEQARCCLWRSVYKYLVLLCSKTFKMCSVIDCRNYCTTFYHSASIFVLAAMLSYQYLTYCFCLCVTVKILYFLLIVCKFFNVIYCDIRYRIVRVIF